MGLFSSKRRVSVSASAMRLIEDAQLPDAVKTGLVTAIFENGDPADYVMEELVSSIGAKAERMFQYGKTGYVYGLPSGQKTDKGDMRRAVQTQLNFLASTTVDMAYSELSAPNVLHMAWTTLVEDHGYSSSTNQLGLLTTQLGTPVYLKDMVIVVPATEADNLDSPRYSQWGLPPNAGYTPQRPIQDAATVALLGAALKHSPVVVEATAVEPYVRVSYVWETALNTFEKVAHEASFSIPIGGVDEEADYYQAAYTANGVRVYWMYLAGSGTYSALDSFYESPVTASGTYFPLTHFRQNKAKLHTDKNSEAYKSSAKLIKRLGLDYDALADGIAENPSASDIEQAFMMMAVPAVSSNEIECRYLFDYFDNQFYNGSAALAISVSRFFSSSTPANTTVIQDGRFKMVLGNAGVIKRRVAGNIGKVGTYTSGITTREIPYEYVDDESGETIESVNVIKYHFYRQQITESLYDEIGVDSLRMTYYVYGGYNVIGEDTAQLLLIPLDHSITDDYSSKDREQLYARSLHFVFTSLQITKVKWYQSGLFKLVLTVISIVMIVNGIPAGYTILGLTALQTIVAIVLISQIVGMYLLPVIFKFFVKVLGQDLAILIAIAAFVYGGYQVTQFGIKGAPYASELLSFSTGLQNAVMQDKFNDLAQSVTDFKLVTDKQTELLEAGNKLLETTSFLSPFAVMGEAPQDFYNRSIHTGNIGLLAISAISSYVDIALKLPELNDTLGEINYGNE